MILAALAIEAGLPDGVLNIVHGTHVSCFSLNLVYMNFLVGMTVAPWDIEPMTSSFFFFL